ncbi:hypothetical protein [Dactylosporangium sp. NPDC051541]|uniref:hypothetical protein n=1 Tax=Dactylosporangium sp. NPDC051541 TaxID=3363977 RepID=UPI0037A3086A
MDDEMIEIARRIRPYLTDLVGPGRAPQIDARLAAILAGRADEDVERVLLADPALLTWAAATLGDPRLRPPALQGVQERGVDLGLGDGETVDAERFDCPQGDYVWYRPSVVYAVPRCPTHDVALVIV